jgi:hypothetical protein
MSSGAVVIPLIETIALRLDSRVRAIKVILGDVSSADDEVTGIALSMPSVCVPMAIQTGVDVLTSLAWCHALQLLEAPSWVGEGVQLQSMVELGFGV